MTNKIVLKEFYECYECQKLLTHLRVCRKNKGVYERESLIDIPYFLMGGATGTFIHLFYLTLFLIHY